MTPCASVDLSLLLDTTVLIDALRGRSAAGRLRALSGTGGSPWTCAINVEEVERGMRPHEQEVVRRFFDGLRHVRLGRAEGERAGAWRREYAERGTTLSQADCLIAAAAVTLGVPLATGNPRHFPMPGLAVQHWPAGE